MEKKNPPRRSTSPRKDNLNNDIQKRSMEAVPRWALAFCAILLVLSFAIRQIGLDITTPLNRIMSAHAVRIETESRTLGAENDQEIEPLKEKVQTQEAEIQSLTKRVGKLELWSHPPSRKKK